MKPCRRGHLGEKYASGGCKTCARERHLRTYTPKQRVLLAVGDRRADKREWRMFWAAKSRAAQKNLPFAITVEDVVIPTTCPVLGIPIGEPTLDRKINHLGYVPGNVFVISKRANRLKADATLEEIEQIAAYMR